MTHPGYTAAALEAAFPRVAAFRSIGRGGEGAVFSVWDRARKADRMLAKRPEARYPDIAERKRELDAALAQDGVTGG
ncbi:MAG: hypothetical protein IT372_26350 [Polyangiaceae bacterium]|nr:hypothetical protein [Polyangiaceae bacterium]